MTSTAPTRLSLQRSIVESKDGSPLLLRSVLWMQTHDSIWTEVTATLQGNELRLVDDHIEHNCVINSKCLVKRVENAQVSANNMFQIFKPGGFKFLLKADTDDERESWMQGLLKAAMHNRIDNSHLYINMKIASRLETSASKASPSASIDTKMKVPATPDNAAVVTKPTQAPEAIHPATVPSKLRGSYSGSSKNGLRHGHGIYELESVRYEGDWEMDFMHGQGVMTSADGCVYRGSWMHGLQHGEGTLKWPDGTEYHGQWHRGSRSGRGVLKSAGADPEYIYSGSFMNNSISGVGVMKWRNGNVYCGIMKNGKGQGKGKLSYGKTGDEYEGDFLNGNRHGQGKLRCNANGITFSGRFMGDNHEPSGLLHYEDGGAFRGAIQSWKRQGHGRMQWQNGDRYEGQWKDDAPHGQGLFQYAMEACTYGGLFQGGKRHGHGKLVFDDGREYDGMWQNDEANGPGRMTYKNGNWYVGDWVKGNRQGQGRFSFRCGSVYEGEFDNGYPSGQGIFISASGVQYDGMFDRWLRHGPGILTLPDDGFVEGVWENDILVEITDVAIPSVPDDVNADNEELELEKAMEISARLDFLPGRRGHSSTLLCFTFTAYDEMDEFGSPINSTR